MRSDTTPARSRSRKSATALAETGIGDPVRRHRLDRFVAAGEFVTALRTSFDPREAQFDRRIDRLIIAQLEMQKADVARAAPVPPVKRISTDEIERSCDRHAILQCQHEQDLCHPSAHRADRTLRVSDRVCPTCVRRYPDRTPRTRPSESLSISAPRNRWISTSACAAGAFLA